MNLKFRRNFLIVVLLALVLFLLSRFDTNAAELLELDGARDYLTLINQDNPYDFGGWYEMGIRDDLVTIADTVDGDPIKVEKATLYAFTLLQSALSKEGMLIGIFDGYRDYYRQKELYEAYQDTGTFVAKPGYTEYHTGLLLSVVIWYPNEWNWIEEERGPWYSETPERTVSMPYFKVLHEHLADYGFIDRFPAGKDNYTGVPNLPNVIRFVGSSEVAHAIMDRGITLEEYLEEPPLY